VTFLHEQVTEVRQHFDKALSLYSIESDQSAVFRVENALTASLSDL
jgi:hypothetical protein